jgi:hypothetical protein
MTSFDKELWKKCCDEEQVEFVSKNSPEYPFVLQRYREQLEIRNTPEYKEHVKQQTERARVLQEKKEEEQKVLYEKRVQALENKKAIKQGQKIAAANSISWGS